MHANKRGPYSAIIKNFVMKYNQFVINEDKENGLNDSKESMESNA